MPGKPTYEELERRIAALEEKEHERQKVEEALKISEDRYREIVEGTENLVTEVNAQGRFTFVNEAARKIFGLAPDDCIGRLAFDFVHPDDREKTLNHFAGWVAAKEPSVTFENRQVSLTGVVRDMLWSIKFHSDRQGNITSIKSIARDITERKNAEKELEHYRELLEDLVRERTAELEKANELLKLEVAERTRIEKEIRQYAETQEVLVREVNHRVKNNLSAIIGMLHMEQDRAETEGLISHIPVLQDLVGRIGGLSTVHSLLSASGWKPLEVSELCRAVVNATLQSVPWGRRIHVEITPSRVRIDSNQAHHLTLIINELTTNAIKYALGNRHQANIRIRIQMTDHTVEILFRDDGPGYPEAVFQSGYAPTSIGFELIRGIARRSLAGDVTFSNLNGAVARIWFPNILGLPKQEKKHAPKAYNSCRHR